MIIAIPFLIGFIFLTIIFAFIANCQISLIKRCNRGCAFLHIIERISLAVIVLFFTGLIGTFFLFISEIFNTKGMDLEIAVAPLAWCVMWLFLLLMISFAELSVLIRLLVFEKDKNLPAAIEMGLQQAGRFAFAKKSVFYLAMKFAPLGTDKSD